MQDRLLAGRYRLESQLGQGGMGSVWRAEHLTLHSAVAIKLMDPAIAATPEGAERFRREAQAAASLRSTHVVQVLDYGVEEGTPFLVMELLHGESLAGCLAREGRLTPTHTLSIMTQVARAIARAHTAGIVHRDLKPDNIFLVPEDDQEVVKVLDFGIAKTPDAVFGDMKTRTGMVMGTPHYMSPEQAEGKRTVDQRTDLWAMAVIICECITGIQPFRGETWGELLLNVCARPIPAPSSLARVPVGFDAWFEKATNRDQTQRFGSAQELLSSLRQVLEGSGALLTPMPALAGAGRDQPIVEARTFDATNPHQAITGPRLGAPVVATITDTTATPPTIRTDAYGGAPSIAGVPTKRSLLPLLLASSLLLALGLGTTTLVLLQQRSESPPAALPLPSAVDALASPVAPPVVTTMAQTTLTNPRRVASGPAVAPATSKPRNVPEAPTAPGQVTDGPAPARTPTTAPPATERTPGKTLKCYTDPFTGIIRLEGVGPRATGAQPYPCRQNPFTGQYQRL